MEKEKQLEIQREIQVKSKTQAVQKQERENKKESNRKTTHGTLKCLYSEKMRANINKDLI